MWTSRYSTSLGIRDRLGVNNFLSGTYLVPFGVLRGSYLGPLSFNLHVNVAKQGFGRCKLLMFVNDLKVYKDVTSGRGGYCSCRGLCHVMFP